MQESELLHHIKQGNSKAFFELVALYKQRVLNTCYRFLLSKEDAEDVSQEVFVEVYQSIHSFRAESSLATWIYRIAVTKSLDELKKRKRKKRITSIGRMLHLDDVATWLTGGKKADEALYEKESLKEIYSALDQLPDNQRAAFTLSKVEGYSNGEIADILQTSVSAVEALMHRAKKRLSEILSKEKE